MKVKPIPDGYHSITPYLPVQGAASLISFLQSAFDAKNVERIERPDGTIGHAEVRIGDSIVMLCDTMNEMKPMPATIYLYVNDADNTYERAVKAGAVSRTAPTTQFYGDRVSCVTDPSGNNWWIASRVENVSADELKRRAQEAMSK